MVLSDRSGGTISVHQGGAMLRAHGATLGGTPEPKICGD